MKYIVEICAAIDIAILGIAYPLLIDKTSNIGEKYKSEYLANIFDLEFPQIKFFRNIGLSKYLFFLKNLSFFKLILIVTISCLFFLVLNLQPILSIECGFINRSADYLVLIFTILLTICFFFWLDKLMLYHGKSSQLLRYLINMYNSSAKENDNKTYLLKTINEFTIHAIESQDEHLEETLVEFYNLTFSKIKNETNNNQAIEFPIDFYFITNKIISTSLKFENSKLRRLAYNASSSTWLIGNGFRYTKISKTTYNWLWNNIVSISDSNKFLANYWSSSSQFFQYGLSHIPYEYSGTKIVNRVVIDERIKERERFIELNYALGGLLIYKKKFEGIKYILSFSQSQPPSYILLPQTMDEIFEWFDHFSNEYKNIEDPIDYKYTFPGLDNLGISRNVNHNICLFIALLFVRQFTLHTIYIYQNFTEFHRLTNNLQELYSLNDRLEYFKNCITKIIENKDLLEELNYEVNPEEIFKVFEKLTSEIKQKIDLTKLNADLSEDKVKQFKEATKDTIKNAFSEYNIINNPDSFLVDEQSTMVINGELILSSKSSFTDIDIPSMNFDTVYSSHIAQSKIKYYLPNSFLTSRTDRYLLEPNDIIAGLEKITQKNLNLLILSVSPSYEIRQLLEKSIFKDVVILPSSNSFIDNCFFILDKRDLPKLEFKELTEAEISKFKLEHLDKEINLYASVIDINKAENSYLKNEYLTKDESELKVLVMIAFICLIKWRKNRKIIQLSVRTQFRERGVANNLDDVQPL